MRRNTTISHTLPVIATLSAAIGILSFGCKGEGPVAANCLTLPESGPVSARYERTVSHRDGQVDTDMVDMLQVEGEVAYVDVPKGVVEHWKRRAGGEASLTRHFAAFKRSIDYTTGDLRTVGQSHAWQHRSRLLDFGAVKDRLQSNGAESYRCLQTAEYNGTVGAEKLAVSWLSAADIPAAFSIERGETTVVYKLVEIHSPAYVASRWKEWATYDAMDFADIGDNEADPFVAKLLHLGAVEHGSSVYRADGTPHPSAHAGHAH